VALERTGSIDEAKAAYAEASFLSPKYLKAQLNASRLASLDEPATDIAVETVPMSEE
jgi:hypothetical protein